MYCTPEDVAGEIYIPLYAKMAAKFDGDGALDEFLSQNIVRAGDYVDARLSGAFDVPFSAPVPPVIATATAKIAAFFATARFSEQEDVAKDKMDAADTMLDSLVASGKLPGEPGRSGNLVGGSAGRVFTDEVLRRW